MRCLIAYCATCGAAKKCTMIHENKGRRIRVSHLLRLDAPVVFVQFAVLYLAVAVFRANFLRRQMAYVLCARARRAVSCNIVWCRAVSCGVARCALYLSTRPSRGARAKLDVRVALFLMGNLLEIHKTTYLRETGEPRHVPAHRPINALPPDGKHTIVLAITALVWSYGEFPDRDTEHRKFANQESCSQNFPSRQSETTTFRNSRAYERNQKR